jgi:hypothetical protein
VFSLDANSLPYLETTNALAKSCHLARKLMALLPRPTFPHLVTPIVVKIGPANTGRHYLEQHLTGTGNRNILLDNPDVLPTIKISRLHARHNFSLLRNLMGRQGNPLSLRGRENVA